MEQINKKFAEINDLKAFLDSTDYQVIKEAEGGYVVSEEIIEQRQHARAQINVLEKEIEDLELLHAETAKLESGLDF